jgi:hypothetical protein
MYFLLQRSRGLAHTESLCTDNSSHRPRLVADREHFRLSKKCQVRLIFARVFLYIAEHETSLNLELEERA